MEIDVRHIAKLAMLKIPEEQVEAFEKELSGIVAMVENLPEIPRQRARCPKGKYACSHTGRPARQKKEVKQ